MRFVCSLSDGSGRFEGSSAAEVRCTGAWDREYAMYIALEESVPKVVHATVEHLLPER